MAGAAEALFERIGERGWEYLESLVGEKHEGLHFDCKLRSHDEPGQVDRNDKKNFSKAIGGFANAAGGVLLWGANAERRDGEDVLQELVPIPEVDQLESKLREIEPEMTDPGVDGIKYEVIRSPGDDTCGVIAVLIPQSESAPHLVRGGSLHGYYKRSGHTFVPMEHYEVADMFGRRPRPDLSVDIEIKDRGKSTIGGVTSYTFELDFILVSEGGGLVRFPALDLLKIASARIEGGLRRVALQEVASPQGWDSRFAGGVDTVLYPGDRLVAAKHRFKVPAEGELGDEVLEFHYRAHAEGIKPIEGKRSFSLEDLRQRRRP